jgi:hypothetical protein
MLDSSLFIEFAVSQSRESEDNAYRRLLWGILIDAFYVKDHAFTTRMKKQLAETVTGSGHQRTGLLRLFGSATVSD